MTGATVGVVLFRVLPSMKMIILGMRCCWYITTACDIVFDVLVTGSTGEVFADRVHVHIEFTFRHSQ